MSDFTNVTSISLIKEQNNYNFCYSIDNNLHQRTLLLKSLLTDFEIKSMILKNRVFKLMEFENELDSKKLYPLKPPFHHLLSQNSDVECTIRMTSDLTLHEICNYLKNIVLQDTDDFTQTTIIIPTGEEELTSPPHKDISKQLFREENEKICVNIKNKKNTHTSLLTASEYILTPIVKQPGPTDTLSGESSLLQFRPFSNEKTPIFGLQVKSILRQVALIMEEHVIHLHWKSMSSRLTLMLLVQ